jgi:hypothetical protein
MLSREELRAAWGGIQGALRSTCPSTISVKSTSESRPQRSVVSSPPVTRTETWVMETPYHRRANLSDGEPRYVQSRPSRPATPRRVLNTSTAQSNTNQRSALRRSSGPLARKRLYSTANPTSILATSRKRACTTTDSASEFASELKSRMSKVIDETVEWFGERIHQAPRASSFSISRNVGTSAESRPCWSGFEYHDGWDRNLESFTPSHPNIRSSSCSGDHITLALTSRNLDLLDSNP